MGVGVLMSKAPLQVGGSTCGMELIGAKIVWLPLGKYSFTTSLPTGHVDVPALNAGWITLGIHSMVYHVGCMGQVLTRRARFYGQAKFTCGMEPIGAKIVWLPLGKYSFTPRE